MRERAACSLTTVSSDLANFSSSMKYTVLSSCSYHVAPSSSAIAKRTSSSSVPISSKKSKAKIKLRLTVQEGQERGHVHSSNSQNDDLKSMNGIHFQVDFVGLHLLLQEFKGRWIVVGHLHLDKKCYKKLLKGEAQDIRTLYDPQEPCLSFPKTSILMDTKSSWILKGGQENNVCLLVHSI